MNTYPWRAICQISITAGDGNPFVGTGWLAGPRLLITAGHCVYMHARGGWVRNVTVHAADSGNAAPVARSSGLRSVSGWVEQRSLASDYGAVFLNEPIGNALGQFGYAAVPNSTFGRVAVNIAGYPDDKEPPGSLWWHERRVERATSNALLYTIDTCGGQSGAPVWFVDGVKRTVVGIHGNGLDRANMAARITADVFANIQRWNQEAERAI